MVVVSLGSSSCLSSSANEFDEGKRKLFLGAKDEIECVRACECVSVCVILCLNGDGWMVYAGRASFFPFSTFVM